MDQDLSGRYMVAAGWGKQSDGKYLSWTIYRAEVNLNSQIYFDNPKVIFFQNQSEAGLLGGLFVNFLCKQLDRLKFKITELSVCFSVLMTMTTKITSL